MTDIKNVINVDPEIAGGQPVFKGTRIPLDIMFQHLENGLTLHDFLTSFPSVQREQAVAVLEIAGKILSAHNFMQLYEAAA